MELRSLLLSRFLFQTLFLSYLITSTNSLDAPSVKRKPLEATEVKKALSILILTSIYPAHFFPLQALGEELVARGHKVTMLGPILEGYEHLPVRVMEKGINFISSGIEPRSSYDIARHSGKHDGGNFLSMMYNLTKLYKDIDMENNHMVNMTKLVNAMNYREYDYTICDHAVIPVAFYLLKKWNTDKLMILLAPVPMHPPGLASWSFPKFFSPFTDDMSFTDRLLNTAVYTPLEWAGLKLVSLFLNFNEDMVTNETFDVFLGVKFPIIYNSVVGFDWPRTSLPLQHYVGPMLSAHPPPLDSALSKWLIDKQKRSVIYFSMGTSVDVTPAIASAILKLSSNYSIVWSLREASRSSIQGLEIDEEVVFITSWVSQVVLLKHPSILYSIMQCGIGSVQESLYHGVPVVCIPSAFDQYDTSLRLVSQGLGRRLLPGEVNEENLEEAIQHLSSEVIRSNVHKLSKIMKANKGAKKAADLVELYVEVGHQHGIPSYAKYNWNWYQYYNLDVYIVILVAMSVMTWLVRKLCYACSSHCQHSRRSRNGEKTKKD